MVETHHGKMKENGKMAKDVLQDVLVKQGHACISRTARRKEAWMKEKSLRHKEATFLDAPALQSKK